MIAFYLRLSLADGDLSEANKMESYSIENQRALLKSYVDSHDELTDDICEYVDDGYTGTNFNRPGFLQMIEDAKKGKIQCIIVKDMSRLGRNYIEVGDYLEQIFPVLGVRFIAVNSGYDSNEHVGKSLGLDFTITNLMNHLYSRDISKKAKSAFRVRWSKGICTNSRAPYGYEKDPHTKGKWRIDPVAGQVVRRIFDKAIEGWSTKMIVEMLNQEKIKTPGQYRMEKIGEKVGKPKVPGQEVLWNTGMVVVILHRYEYTGAFVFHHHRTVAMGTTQVEKVPIEERYITENANDAIVTKEEFEQAQLAIKNPGNKKAKVKKNYSLRGKLRCGNCGLALSYTAEYDYLHCPHKLASGSFSQCYKERYDYKQVEHIVTCELKRMIDYLISLNGRMKQLKQKNLWNDTSDVLKKEKRIAKLKSDRVLAYEAFADGRLSKDLYLAKKEKITIELETLQQECDFIRETFSKERSIEETMQSLLKNGQVGAIGKLTKEVADIFIDTVYVYDPTHIEIVYTFEDYLEDAIHYIESKEAMENKGKVACV